MDTLLFDNIYTNWINELQKVLNDKLHELLNDENKALLNIDFDSFKNSAAQSFYNTNLQSSVQKSVKEHLEKNESPINSWLELLSQDSIRYDILMWLKAKSNTSFWGNGSIPFKEKVFKELYHIEDKKTLQRFNDGLKRCKEYYKEDLFKYITPPLFMCVYSTKTFTKYNPFLRYECDVDLESFFQLKDELETNANIYISKIPDEEIRACQRITTAYYLENTYGFEIKKYMAHTLSKMNVEDTVYQPDYFKSIIKRALLDFFQKKVLPIELPKKYSSINIQSFKEMIAFFTAKEYDFLLETVSTPEYNNRDYLSKFTPEPGYLLMVLLFVETVLFYHLREIDSCMKCAENRAFSTVEKTLKVSKAFALNTQTEINKLLNRCDFSTPDNHSITMDEEVLLTDINSLSKIISEKNEAFKNEPDFKRKLHATVTDNCTGKKCDIQDMDFDDEEPPELYMLSEYEFLTRFKRHCGLYLDKSDINGSLDRTKAGKNLNVSNSGKKAVSGADVRKFKNVIIELMKNCFNHPTIAKHNNIPKLNYLVQEMPTQSTVREDEYKKQIALMKMIRSNKCLLISLQNSLLRSPTSVLYLFLEDVREILDFYLGDLYEKLITSFESPGEFRKYISSIYNTEVLEHIKKNLCFEEEIDFGRLDKQIQKRIAES